MTHTATHTEVENKAKAVVGVLSVIRRVVDNSTTDKHYKKMSKSGLALYDWYDVNYVPAQCFEAMKQVIDGSTVSKDMREVVHTILDELIEDCRKEKVE